MPSTGYFNTHMESPISYITWMIFFTAGPADTNVCCNNLTAMWEDQCTYQAIKGRRPIHLPNTLGYTPECHNYGSKHYIRTEARTAIWTPSATISTYMHKMSPAILNWEAFILLQSWPHLLAKTYWLQCIVKKIIMYHYLLMLSLIFNGGLTMVCHHSYWQNHHNFATIQNRSFFVTAIKLRFSRRFHPPAW